MQENEKQKFVLYAVPCNKPFVVAAEKSEEFIKQSATHEDKEFVHELAEEFRNNNLIEDSICNRAFVVAAEKAEEFMNLKPNPELKEKIEAATKKLTNLRIELEPIKKDFDGLTLKKVLKPEKK